MSTETRVSDEAFEGLLRNLTLSPITLAEAKTFITEHHRHHKAPIGHKFSIGLRRRCELVGCIVVGRPVARALDDGFTAEISRSCVIEGVPNGNSMLYGAAWRAAKAMGYTRAITYTQEGESGASLRGAGWQIDAELAARGSWAESSVQLRDKRDSEGSGGVARTRWTVAVGGSGTGSNK